MSRAVLIRWVKVLVRFGLPALVLVFFAIQVKNNWSALASHRFEWNPVLLGLAFLGFVLQELSFGLIWKNVLARLGYHLPLGASLRIYLGSEFVRYIPGNVWHVLTRILWVGKYGVPRSLAFTSMVVARPEQAEGHERVRRPLHRDREVDGAERAQGEGDVGDGVIPRLGLPPDRAEGQPADRQRHDRGPAPVEAQAARELGADGRQRYGHDCRVQEDDARAEHRSDQGQALAAHCRL
jgi:hypothetical protein